jgi:capsular exopolysaccharide synthesis family protein
MNTGDDQTTLRDYWRVLRRRKAIVLVGVLATLIPAVALSLTREPVYSAEAQMLIRGLPGESLFDSAAGTPVNPDRIGQNAIQVLEGERVRDQLEQTLGITDPPSVEGERVDDTDVVTVTVESGDPETAAQLADAYVAAYIATQRGQAVAGLEAAATELQARVDDLGERIAAIDDQIGDAVIAREAQIVDKRGQITTLVSQRTDLETDLSELDLTTTDGRDQRRVLLPQINEVQASIDALNDDIVALQNADDAVLERSRQVLFDQETEFVQRLDELQVDASLSEGGAQLIASALVPDDPVAPRPVRTGLIALLAGLVLGMAAAFLLDYFDDSIKVPADLAQLRNNTIAVLASVPDEVPPDNRPISVSKPESFAVEAYRVLRTNVQFLGLERSMQVIEITSAVPGEGKTTTAANLAVVLSQTGASVVLVDADLRKPRIHRVFAIDGSLGLTNNLAGEAIDMTIQLVGEHLSIIVAGPIPPNPSELLSGRRMGSLIDELRLRFDYVVIDSAPALAVSDAAALTPHVDGLLVVVQAGRTTLPRLRQTLETLDQVSAPVLGVVLNRADLHEENADEYTYGIGYGQVPGDVRRDAKTPVKT